MRRKRLYIPAGFLIFTLAVTSFAVSFVDTATTESHFQEQINGLSTRVAALEALHDVDPPATATELPTATDVPSTATPEPTATDEPVAIGDRWHAPGTHDVLNAHEHGDAVPSFADAFSMEHFGHPVIYGGDEATPNENELKHQAFKGYSFTADGVDIYFRNHAQANPHGHVSRYHSYEIYARDASGGVSFWQGYQDFGGDNGSVPNLSFSNCGGRTSPGPILSANSVNCGGVDFENWYSSPGGVFFWTWDTGLNMGASYYHEGDPMDISTWTPAGGNSLNRRVEVSWYADRASVVPRDTWFCAEASGQILGFAEGNSPNGCSEGLPQYIAETMTTVAFPGNSYSKIYDGPVGQPN